MDERTISKRVGHSLAWVGGASLAIGILDVIVGILLTVFWLSPSDLGIAALALWLFPIGSVFADGGLSSAIVQRDATSDEALSSLFWVNVALSMVAVGVVLVGADVLAGHPTAGAMLRVYSFKLVLDNAYLVPQALLKRDLRFRELSLVRVAANLAYIAGKVGFAAAGFGAWCFLYGQLGHMLVTAIGTQLYAPWRPRFVFRLRESAAMLRFGWKTAAREILFHFYVNADYRVVYAFFGEAATGIYRFAYERVLDPVRAVSLVVTDVAFPTFARLAARREAVIEQFVRFTRANLLAIAPVMALIAVAGDDVVRLIWPGDKWLSAVPAMRVLCVVGVLRALSFVLPPLFDGLARPIVPLLYTVFAATLLPGCYVLCAWLLGPTMGFLSVAVAWTVGYPIAFGLLLGLALRQLRLPVARYLRWIGGIPLCVAGASVAGLGTRWLAASWSPGLRLAAVGVVMGGVLAALLGRFEGITPRTVLGSIRGAPGDEPPSAPTAAPS